MVERIADAGVEARWDDGIGRFADPRVTKRQD
jgi:hypothetical protein